MKWTVHDVRSLCKQDSIYFSGKISSESDALAMYCVYVPLSIFFPFLYFLFTKPPFRSVYAVPARFGECVASTGRKEGRKEEGEKSTNGVLSNRFTISWQKEQFCSVPYGPCLARLQRQFAVERADRKGTIYKSVIWYWYAWPGPRRLRVIICVLFIRRWGRAIRRDCLAINSFV